LLKETGAQDSAAFYWGRQSGVMGGRWGDFSRSRGAVFCWNHKILNVLDAVNKKEHAKANRHLKAMMYAESRDQALRERKRFEDACRHNPKAVKSVVVNWDRLTSYYIFPIFGKNRYL
jgi:transposase-like protein